MNRIFWIGLVALLTMGLVALADHTPRAADFSVSVTPLACEEVDGRLVCYDGQIGKQQVCIDLTTEVVLCTNEAESARELLRDISA